MWRRLAVVGLLLVVVLAKVEQPTYTEDLEVFKSDKRNARLELLVGCWLLSREHSAQKDTPYQLALIKACLRRITRKDSVLKITQLVGKNVEPPKTYAQIVPPEETPQPGSVPLQLSQFDLHLLQMTQKYESDLSGVQGAQGETLKQRMQQQLKKRTKYYLGFIPANEFTHLLMLISVALLLVLICTCWKYYKNRSAKKDQNRQEYFKKSAGGFTKQKKK